MDSKYLFIINPTSGLVKVQNPEKKIHQFCKAKGLDYDIVYTKGPGHGQELASQGGYSHYIAVGGDGTVSELASALVGTDGILGIIPMGTGNDTVRSLSIPLKVNQAMERLVEGQVSTIDMGRAGDRYFINIFSIGLDAEVVKFTNKYKKNFPRAIAYHIGIIAGVILYKKIHLKIQGEGYSFYGNTMLFAVGNGAYYGGGIPILPKSTLEDGVLDVINIKEMNKFNFIPLVFKMFKEKHLDYRGVDFFKAKKLEVESAGWVYLNYDGEIELFNGRLEIELLEKSLKVLT